MVGREALTSGQHGIPVRTWAHPTNPSPAHSPSGRAPRKRWNGSSFTNMPSPGRGLRAGIASRIQLRWRTSWKISPNVKPSAAGGFESRQDAAPERSRSKSHPITRTPAPF